MKILVVDDEQRIRDLIGQYLMVEGYDVEYAKDGIDALTKISKGDIDLVILDVMMPFMDGITCLREMRSRGFKTPVIILSAKGEEYDKITGFDAGTDDYVVKPFSPKELMARVKAVINRVNPEIAESKERYIFGSLVIDVPSHSVRIDGENISDGELASLTEYIKPIADQMTDKPTEFELITALAFEYFSSICLSFSFINLPFILNMKNKNYT